MGKIITFYSFKGGVGRTMALANIAYLLARRGKKVLVVDMDLEAPGLHQYITRTRYRRARDERGMAGLLEDLQHGCLNKDVSDFTIDLDILEAGVEKGASLEFIPSGMGHDGYETRVLSLDWQVIFSKEGARRLEEIRDQWRANYDHVLVDSRTGITDAGGFCTIFLPDALAVVFTTNSQSFYGAIHIAEKVKDKRQLLAFDRGGALVLPILSRFDGRSQQREAEEWLAKITEQMAPCYDDWIAEDVPIELLLERTKIPHVPMFSFGEKLPAATHSLTDPDLPGFYYENIAHLIAGGFTPNSSRVAAGMLAPSIGDSEMDIDAISNVLAEVANATPDATETQDRLRAVEKALLASLDAGIRESTFKRWVDAAVELHEGLNRHGERERAFALIKLLNDEVLQFLWNRPTAAIIANYVSEAFVKIATTRIFRSVRDDDQVGSLLDMALRLQQAIYDETGSNAATKDIVQILLRLSEFHWERSHSDDTTKALEYLERARSLIEMTLESDPVSEQALSDLGLCWDRTGALYLRRNDDGDADRALNSYLNALSVKQRSLDAHPDSVHAAREVTISLSMIGELHLQRVGEYDLDIALDFFERDVSLRKTMLAKNSSSQEFARALSLSLGRLGDLYARRSREGDVAQAQSCYEQGLAISEALLKNGPMSWQSARDVTASLNKLAELYIRRGGPDDLELAIEYLERIVSVLGEHRRSEPVSPQLARELSMSLNKLGDLYLQRSGEGDSQRALLCFERSGFSSAQGNTTTEDHNDSHSIGPRQKVRSQLTQREIEFLRLVCAPEEYTYEQIADIMGVHRRTLDGYREGLFEKFGIKSKTGLVLFAMKWGIANP